MCNLPNSFSFVCHNFSIVTYLGATVRVSLVEFPTSSSFLRDLTWIDGSPVCGQGPTLNSSPCPPAGCLIPSEEQKGIQCSRLPRPCFILQIPCTNPAASDMNSGTTSSSRWIKGLFPIVGISKLALRGARSWLYSPKDPVFGPDANGSGLITWALSHLTTSWAGSSLSWTCPTPI